MKLKCPSILDIKTYSDTDPVRAGGSHDRPSQSPRGVSSAVSLVDPNIIREEERAGVRGQIRGAYPMADDNLVCCRVFSSFFV